MKNIKIFSRSFPRKSPTVHSDLKGGRKSRRDLRAKPGGSTPRLLQGRPTALFSLPSVRGMMGHMRISCRKALVPPATAALRALTSAETSRQ